MGQSMTVRRTVSGQSAPRRMPLRMRVFAAPAKQAASMARAGKTAAGKAQSSAVCLRGVAWGLAFEGMAALLIYGIWRAALVLR